MTDDDTERSAEQHQRTELPLVREALERDREARERLRLGPDPRLPQDKCWK
jgi:hypothetical protein